MPASSCHTPSVACSSWGCAYIVPAACLRGGHAHTTITLHYTGACWQARRAVLHRAAQVHVLCAEVEGYDNLRGQLLAVEVSSLRDTIGSLKERLADVLDVAANKQRISREGLGFLRDELSLAHYNVSPDVQLQLGVKERGGRKK